jgi:hypothetical protein
MLLEQNRRWHPRYWDDEQFDLVVRWTIPLAGGTSDEAEELIQDRLDQVSNQ